MIQVISGTFSRRRLVTPKGASTRPTTSQIRQAVFNMCQNEVENARFLDIAAGSGSMGIEAISRGAAKATFIDSDRDAYDAICENIASLKIESQCEIIPLDAMTALKKLCKQEKEFDLCYFDPPYTQKAGESSLSREVLTFLDKSSLLAPSARLFMEESKLFSLDGVDLSTLILQDTRRFGNSYLYSFVKSAMNI